MSESKSCVSREGDELTFFLLIGHTVSDFPSSNSPHLPNMARRSPSSDTTSTSAQPGMDSSQVPVAALTQLLQMAQRRPVTPQDLTAALREAGIEATFPPLPPQVGPARPEHHPNAPVGPAGLSHHVQNLLTLPGPSFTPVRGPADGSMASRAAGDSSQGQSATPTTGTYQVPLNGDLSPIGTQVRPHHSISSLESGLSSDTASAFNSALAVAGQLLMSQSRLSQPTLVVFFVFLFSKLVYLVLYAESACNSRSWLGRNSQQL